MNVLTEALIHPIKTHSCISHGRDKHFVLFCFFFGFAFHWKKVPGDGWGQFENFIEKNSYTKSASIVGSCQMSPNFFLFVFAMMLSVTKYAPVHDATLFGDRSGKMLYLHF